MTYFTKIILHMSIMLVFLLLTTAGIITAKFFKKRNTNWIKIHKTLMLSGVLSAFLGIGWIIYVVQSEQGLHFYASHTFLGLGTFILALTAPILGILFTSKKTNKDLKSVLRRFHRIIGWVSLILIVITVFTGFLLSGILSLPF